MMKLTDNILKIELASFLLFVILQPNVFTGSSKKVSVGVDSKEVITAEHNLSGTFISIKDEHMERYAHYE